MILDKIVLDTRKRVEQLKKEISVLDMKNQAEAMDAKTGFPFYNALKKEHISFICEVKKASPSKGIIATDFDYVQIAKDYQAAGADAISVLTEPNFFLGSPLYLQEIRAAVDLPIIMKDFVIDSYQIHKAKVIGADAVLLICSILDKQRLSEYIRLSKSLGLATLVEAHTQEEVLLAVECGAKIIGVNNRNLNNFEIDFSNSINLRKLVPQNTVFVAESGIKTRADIEKLEQSSVNAVLIGETLMRSQDKAGMLAQLRGQI